MASTSENAPFIRFQLEPPPALAKLMKIIEFPISLLFLYSTRFCFQTKNYHHHITKISILKLHLEIYFLIYN